MLDEIAATPTAQRFLVRRLLAALACALAMTILVAAPAMAMYHDKISNPLLQTLGPGDTPAPTSSDTSQVPAQPRRA